MTLLDELAIRHCTDKQPSFHNYTPMYSRWMESRRMEVKRVLEIGLGMGGSARMWHEYFPSAEIWIVDIRPMVNAEGCKIVMGNQAHQSTWDKLPDGFDFVIDDGSHVPEDQVVSVNIGFHKLLPGGLWFIEDTHCNFHPNFNASGVDIIYKWAWDVILRQQSNISVGGNFYKARVDMPEPEKDIVAVHFYKSVIALEKVQ